MTKEKPPNWFPNPGDLYHHHRTGFCIVLSVLPPKSVGTYWSLRVLSNKEGPAVLEDISFWDMQFVSSTP